MHENHFSRIADDLNKNLKYISKNSSSSLSETERKPWCLMRVRVQHHILWYHKILYRKKDSC